MPSPVRVALPDGRGYDVAFAPLAETPRLLAEAGLRPGPCLLVTDAHVGPRYLGGLVSALEEGGWTPRARMIPPGEASKGTASLGALYDWALAPPEGHPVPDRQTPVLALGGGVVGDLAGFFAATLLRGLPLVHLPTTLVAQADSAIGGKTGVNHPEGKNLIGAFHQPRLVVADPATLQTLPEREWTSGLAEVVKAALIADADFFDWQEATWEAVSAREPEAVAHLVRRAVAIKAEVVAEDERESGRRGTLNFGHTFGHALERVGGYGACTHGEAVAVGMRAALYLSSLLSPALDRARADALVARLPVPPAVADLPLNALLAAMHHDKKRAEGRLRFVVLDRIGAARLTSEASARQVETAWAFALGAVRASARAA
jgi:3-dehydroquinate synthase